MRTSRLISLTVLLTVLFAGIAWAEGESKISLVDKVRGEGKAAAQPLTDFKEITNFLTKEQAGLLDPVCPQRLFARVGHHAAVAQRAGIGYIKSVDPRKNEDGSRVDSAIFVFYYYDPETFETEDFQSEDFPWWHFVHSETVSCKLK